MKNVHPVYGAGIRTHNLSNMSRCEVVVAQLVEWLLPLPEVCGLNPVIGKIYIEHLFTINCIENTKINKKRLGMAHF